MEKPYSNGVVSSCLFRLFCHCHATLPSYTISYPRSYPSISIHQYPALFSSPHIETSRKSWRLVRKGPIGNEREDQSRRTPSETYDSRKVDVRIVDVRTFDARDLCYIFQVMTLSTKLLLFTYSRKDKASLLTLSYFIIIIIIISISIMLTSHSTLIIIPNDVVHLRTKYLKSNPFFFFSLS